MLGIAAQPKTQIVITGKPHNQPMPSFLLFDNLVDDVLL